MTTLYFQRFHTRGTLKGLYTFGEISFSTVQACVAWKDSINSARKQRNLSYRVVDYSFQKFAR